MSNKNINRRDFLKLGTMAAITLPTITKIGQIGNEDLLESSETFGGFLVRTRSDDDPAYQVDQSAYQRFDAKNAIFSRIFWDTEFSQKVNSVEPVYNAGDPGYEHIDVALKRGAGFCAGYNGTASATMGKHAGLLSLDAGTNAPPQGPSFDERWDYGRYSPEEVANIIKKASLFLGASLVGIAPLDERWLYSHYFDMMESGGAPISVTEVEEIKLPEGQLTPEEAGAQIQAELEKMDGDAIKTFMLDIIENAGDETMAGGGPPTSMIKMMPGSQFKERLSMFTNMPTPMLRIMAEKLGLDFEITTVDLGESARPRYLEDGTLAIPETMKTVIVLAFEMDIDSVEANPTALGTLANQDGYSKMAITAGSLAEFIKGLGYNAIPCGNNTGLSVPQAIDAGLGELGRNGILITPRYGPRVRLAKVITDLPMAYDKPIRFGVKEFCEVCKKCAEHCPTQAITHGTQSTEPTTLSTNPGVMKWAVNAEECYLGWTANGSGCGVCIKVCPFHKPEGWLHDATRILIGAKSGSLDQILVKLDDASGYGSPEPQFQFWDSDNYIHIKN